MILIDTGPIVALLDSRDGDHEACKNAASTITDIRLVTTWPCITEAMYLLYREGGPPYQHALWRFLDSEVLDVHCPSGPEMDSMRRLMNAYADSPMDVADASIVAAAESLGIETVFAIDRHFHAYRTESGGVLRVIPS